MNGIWVHSKTKKTYKVLGTGFYENTMEMCVIYKEYSNPDHSLVESPRIFIRPLEQWTELVNGEPRFTPRP